MAVIWDEEIIWDVAWFNATINSLCSDNLAFYLMHTTKQSLC